MSDWSWSDFQRQENGERIPSPAFTPGVDFDPNDEGECESVAIATGKHRAETIEHYQRENAALRAQVARLTGEDYE